MARILSIWLPQLPLDRLIRRNDPRIGGPFAVVREIKNAARLSHLNSQALKAGLAPGMSIPDARAICPDLLTDPEDPLRDAALLRALWRWADILSPRIALDAPDGLLLDIKGCAHLFGGEQNMANHALGRLADMQISARIGIADTKGGARALARYGDKEICAAPPGQMHDALKHLPIAALDLEASIVAELAISGLKTIGQLYEIRNGELARRFGLALTQALDTSTGHAPDPITPAAADPVYAARMSLPDPIGYLSDIEGVLERLATSICERLQREQKGARRFRLIVRCVDTGDHTLSVGFAKPCFEVGPILQQFARPLSALKMEFGADWFRLLAEITEPVRIRQSQFGETRETEEQLARTMATLGNRIGFDHIRRFAPYDSHLPEHAFLQTLAHGPEQPERWQAAARARPIRLYQPPEYLRILEPGRPPKKFEWRGASYDNKRSQGPERLTSEWWRARPEHVRDYWQMQTTSGLRLWLLTFPGKSPPEWFVAGRFA